MLKVVWAEKAQGHIFSLVGHYSRGNVQLDSVRAGISDYVHHSHVLKHFEKYILEEVISLPPV